MNSGASDPAFTFGKDTHIGDLTRLTYFSSITESGARASAILTRAKTQRRHLCYNGSKETVRKVRPCSFPWGRYALRVMLELAQGEPGECMPLPVIAQRQGISEKYLESIIAVLARAGLVEGQRGKGGGYRLSRELKDYSVA